MRTEDLVFEAEQQLEDLLSAYWHYREGAERALECTDPDCHHANTSREDMQRGYDAIMAQMCHEIVQVIMDAM